MKFIQKLSVGSVDCPVPVKDFSNQLKTRMRHAKEDNEHFDWKIKSFCVMLHEGEMWIVGYTKQDLR